MTSNHNSELMCQSNEQKFEYLYSKYANAVYRFAYKLLNEQYLAEDVVQETFLSVSKVIDSIKIDNEHSERNYIFKIARNHAYKAIEKQSYLLSDPEGFENQVPDITNLEMDIDDKVNQENLCKLIRKLDSKYSDVLIMKYFKGMSGNEIASALNLTVGTVNTRLTRAKNKLKELLCKEGFYD